MSDVDRSQVAAKAKEFVDGGNYTYKQFRGKGWQTDSYMDCSEFVYQSYKAAGFTNFPDFNTGAMAAAASKNASIEDYSVAAKAKDNQGGFFWIKAEGDVVSGDIIYWPGHVGIVEDPKEGTFLAAASTKSGLRADNYKSGPYWSQRKGRVFIRYLPPPTKAKIPGEAAE